MTKYAERIAALEEQLKGVKEDVGEIKGDVKILVTAYNKQRGFIAATALIFTTLGGLVAAAWNWLADKVHFG